MKILAKKYDSDFTIDIETTLSGMIIGNVVVGKSTIFVVNGTIKGELTIEKNSRALIYGTVNGNIHNYGICEIYGMVNGVLFDKNKSIFIDEHNN